MFRGINAVNIDAKGRLSIPAKYRDRIKSEALGRLVATIDTDEHCLLLYPLPAWEAIEGKLARLPSFNAQARRIQRLLMGHATEADMDSQGRILLPPLLREYAGLEKKVILLGQGNKFEIWSESGWQSRRDHWLDEEKQSEKNDLPDDLQSLSL
ncbi:MAG: division/cell wall cluster transcriptional repressor MraZ [Gammaproteobacteria bacterium]